MTTYNANWGRLGTVAGGKLGGMTKVRNFKSRFQDQLLNFDYNLTVYLTIFTPANERPIRSWPPQTNVMRFISILCLSIFLGTGVSAQGFSGGFRAGLNFNSISGPLEMSDDGMTTYEGIDRTVGFHVGATFAYEVTDLFGFKADLMYSQKGATFVNEDVPSYFYLYTDSNDDEGTRLNGIRNSELDLVNSYITIPLTTYFRFGKFEVEGGISAGYLVQSRINGGITYSDVANFPEDFVFNVTGNYFSDEAAGEGVISTALTEFRPGILSPDGISAYYNHDSNEKLYKRLDFGLVGGLSYYLNSGLYVGARYQLGIADITRDDNDLRISRPTPDDGGRAFNQGDEDFNRSIQISVGFRL